MRVYIEGIGTQAGSSLQTAVPDWWIKYTTSRIAEEDIRFEFCRIAIESIASTQYNECITMTNLYSTFRTPCFGFDGKTFPQSLLGKPMGAK